jgi:glutathione S-transferase
MELISFKLCPFVQRSVITLLEKNVDFKITYIDLDNPPDWFHALSPLGKVPVMQIDDAVLFESAVICEYADEISPPSLQPAAPLQKAHNKAWIAFGAECIFALHGFYTATDENALDTARQDLIGKLAHLEKALNGHAPFFNGADFSLVDAAYAPLFMRFALLEAHFQITSPSLRVWQDNLLAKESVQKSVVDDFPQLFKEYLGMKGSILAGH